MTPPKLPEPPRTIPAVPRVQKESDRPSVDSDRGELFLRELHGVEQRTAIATQKALADLSAVYERELARRDELIRALQESAMEASKADLEFSRELARQRTEFTALVASAATMTVTSNISEKYPDRRETKEIAQGTSRMSKVWATIIAGVVSGIVAGGAMAAKSCSEPSASVPSTAPRPAGTGFAGTP